MRRRDFLRGGALVAAGVGAGYGMDPSLLAARAAAASTLRRVGDPFFRELAMLALDSARSAGATYADVRISSNRNQFVATRERRVTALNDSETFGFGVRVIADGTWGFAASRDLTREEVPRVARQAVAQARASAPARLRPLELAPTESYPEAEWTAPFEVDPFGIPIEDKVALLLEANEAALGVDGARFVNSFMTFLRQQKFFASTEGTVADQTLYRALPSMNITAVASDNSDFQTRQSTDIAPRAAGYEHVTGNDLPANAVRWAEEAVAKLSATPVEPGRYDLVLLPTHLWLTLHESIAHPTELDRISGYEANYAGTSFIYPIEDFLGKFRYGPEFMNVQGERSSSGGLSSVGWDDEGVQPDDYLIVKDGVLNDLQTTREQAPWLADWYASQGLPVRSHGNSYAQSWADIQFQRMPNINLLPHPDRDVPLEEVIGGVERGILIDGHGSFSIDQQRYNAQFGGQVFYEIRGGKITGMLKDVAYQMRTPDFWNSMDAIGGRASYTLGGSFFDGKGQPGQVNAVSHGSPPARFRQVNVINTGRKG
ncbi:MAG TPA: TldD/PmbA family protein [Longimicrobiales bacterium]|nr:TldD/PmbA family protein [Longimicrobiales bacterium]